MDYIVPDTLVLKIEEHEFKNKLIDTTLYILFDKRSKRYVIRGKRRSETDIISEPYSFESENANDLVEFILFILDSDNSLSYTLYNYDNLPNESNDITYNFLNEWDDRSYEIVGYDNKKLKRGNLLKILRILRNVFNYY